MRPTEEELLAAARAGDRRAFDALCQAHRGELYRLCQHFLRDAEDAQDMVQEIFARAWQHLANFRGEARFRSWLWRIGRNRCLNFLEARPTRMHRQAILVDSTQEGDRPREIPDERPTPEQVALRADEQARLQQEIARAAQERGWGSTDWELFLLRIESEVTYADFAARHGKDEGYWRNRWRDKIKPVLDRVRERIPRP